MIHRKLLSLAWQAHEAVNVEINSINTIHGKINNKNAYVCISENIKRISKRYAKLTEKV